MRAGELRQRIKIQDRVVARNGFGEEIATWSTLATVWASIETPTGGEYQAQDRAGAAITQQVTIRHRTGIEPTMRINWNGRLFEIAAVLDDNLKREMRLMCSEVVSEERTT